LHEDPTGPGQDCETVGPQSSDLVVQEECDQRFEGSTEDTEGSNVGSTVRKTGRVVDPKLFEEAIIILESRQRYAGTESSLVVA
jgi:hypothetical protein